MFNRRPKPNKPIVVVVKDGRYDAYAQNSKPTTHDKWLLALLQSQGGVSDTVEDGCYHFDAKLIGLTKIAINLTKVED